MSHLLDIQFDCRDTSVDWSATWQGPSGEVPYPNGTVCGYFLNSTSPMPILLTGYVAKAEESQNVSGEALLVRAIPLTDFDTKEPLYGEGSVYYKSIRNSLLDALIASTINGADGVYRNETPMVHECILSWCVQSIKSSYDWGQYSENVTSTYLNTPDTPFSWPWEAERVEMGTLITYNQNITLEPPASSLHLSNTTISSATYRVDNVTAFNTMAIFDDFFPSYYTLQEGSEAALLRFKNYYSGPSVRELAFNPWQASNNLTHHMERLAQALTNVIRSSGNKEMIPGAAYNKENYVSVRWQWLTLPIGLLCISFIFLAATVTKSAVERDRVGVWKTSAYATLLYGLPDDMQQKITRSGSTGTPRAKAKELKVRLQPNQGWRVSGNLFSPFITKPRQNQPPPGWI